MRVQISLSRKLVFADRQRNKGTNCLIPDLTINQKAVPHHFRLIYVALFRPYPFRDLDHNEKLLRLATRMVNGFHHSSYEKNSVNLICSKCLTCVYAGLNPDISGASPNAQPHEIERLRGFAYVKDIDISQLYPCSGAQIFNAVIIPLSLK